MTAELPPELSPDIRWEPYNGDHTVFYKGAAIGAIEPVMAGWRWQSWQGRQPSGVTATLSRAFEALLANVSRG